MAIDLTTDPGINGRITAPDANYPNGSSKNETAPAAADGTPYIKARADDIFGLQQALLYDSGQVPSGNAETAVNSQYMQGLNTLLKSGAYKSPIVNGDFLIGQRGTNFGPVVDGEYTIDQWQYFAAVDGGALGSTGVDQVAFALGQVDVPDNPEFFVDFEGDVAGGGGSEYVGLQNRIEGAQTLSGQMVTLSFWAKGSIAGTISFLMQQVFGTGGGPSADVNAVVPTDFALTTSWVKHSFTVTLPSVAGKTLGANDDDYLSLSFLKQIGATQKAAWGGAGATAYAGMVQLADIQIEKGRYSSRFERLEVNDQLRRCERFLNVYELYNSQNYVGMGSGTTDVNVTPISFRTELRATPTGTLVGGGPNTASIIDVVNAVVVLGAGPLLLSPLTKSTFSINVQSLSVVQFRAYVLQITGTSFIAWSSEL